MKKFYEVARSPWLIVFLMLVMCPDRSIEAQEKRSWSLYESFQGSTNSAGQVFKLDSGVGYNLNDHFQIGGGVPLYFVRGSSGSTTGTETQTGIGNMYVNLRFEATGPALFTSTITGTAPTGDKDKGFSTGRATVDWNNYIAVPVSRLTPYANLGVANTISDTAFFVRPFTSLGMVGHFEGGATFSIFRQLTMGASAYDIAPTGQQRIVSKIVKRQAQVTSTPSSPSTPSPNAPSRGTSQSGQGGTTTVETVGAADLASDHGFSSWIELAKESDVAFRVGYSRSVRYQFDTVFFSLGFNVSSLFRKNRP